MTEVYAEKSPLLLVSGDREDVLVEFNSNIPMNERRLEQLYGQLDPEYTGYIPIEVAAEFYLSLEHFGLDPTYEEALQYIEKYATSTPGAMTEEEFGCFAWSIARW